jgi:hypothetical protein
MWRATTKIWRGLSKFTVWRVVGGRDIGATVPLQTGNELFGEARGLALTRTTLFDIAFKAQFFHRISRYYVGSIHAVNCALLNLTPSLLGSI